MARRAWHATHSQRAHGGCPGSARPLIRRASPRAGYAAEGCALVAAERVTVAGAARCSRLRQYLRRGCSRRRGCRRLPACFPVACTAAGAGPTFARTGSERRRDTPCFDICQSAYVYRLMGEGARAPPTTSGCDPRQARPLLLRTSLGPVLVRVRFGGGGRASSSKCQ
jgi:hypothetical protein